MQRFYIKDLIIGDDIFPIYDVHIVYQLVKVLRTRIGEHIIIFDGVKNKDYVCEIIDFSKKKIDVKLIKKIKKKSECSVILNLFQALPNKLEKIEYIIQKGVEVGVKNFTFYRSERSQKMSITEKKEERLNKILIEAVEQSGQNFVSHIEILSSSPFEEKGIIGELLNDEKKTKKELLPDENSIFLHTQDTNSLTLKKYISTYSPKKEGSCLNVYVGPEGGFSDEEVQKFEEKKFSRMHLGEKILRTETAGIVTIFTLGQML